jgi:hypothetical protein
MIATANEVDGAASWDLQETGTTNEREWAPLSSTSDSCELVSIRGSVKRTGSALLAPGAVGRFAAKVGFQLGQTGSDFGYLGYGERLGFAGGGYEGADRG